MAGDRSGLARKGADIVTQSCSIGQIRHCGGNPRVPAATITNGSKDGLFAFILARCRTDAARLGRAKNLQMVKPNEISAGKVLTFAINVRS
jgi:hypothetical protein